jgi:hypothetical protein
MVALSSVNQKPTYSRKITMKNKLPNIYMVFDDCAEGCS